MSSPDATQLINTLSHDEALSLLKQLASSNEELALKIISLIVQDLHKIEMEELATIVFDELNALDVEDIWDRSGNTRDGYVEPSEAAEQIIAETLAPFLAQLKKALQLGMKDNATQICMGIVQSLNWFEYNAKSEFHDWAPDLASAFADDVVEQWKQGKPSRAERRAMKAFVEEELSGGWGVGCRGDWRRQSRQSLIYLLRFCHPQ